MAIENTYIGLQRNTSLPQLSPHEFYAGKFMFGDMLHFTTTPPTRITTTIAAA